MEELNCGFWIECYYNEQLIASSKLISFTSAFCDFWKNSFLFTNPLMVTFVLWFSISSTIRSTFIDWRPKEKYDSAQMLPSCSLKLVMRIPKRESAPRVFLKTVSTGYWKIEVLIMTEFWIVSGILSYLLTSCSVHHLIQEPDFCKK